MQMAHSMRSSLSLLSVGRCRLSSYKSVGNLIERSGDALGGAVADRSRVGLNVAVACCASPCCRAISASYSPTTSRSRCNSACRSADVLACFRPSWRLASVARSTACWSLRMRTAIGRFCSAEGAAVRFLLVASIIMLSTCTTRSVPVVELRFLCGVLTAGDGCCVWSATLFTSGAM